MTLKTISKTTLLLGASVMMLACTETGTPSTESEPEVAVVHQKAEMAKTTRPYKMISYDTPGQTDADHLWLEEVQGIRVSLLNDDDGKADIAPSLRALMGM